MKWAARTAHQNLGIQQTLAAVKLIKRRRIVSVVPRVTICAFRRSCTARKTTGIGRIRSVAPAVVTLFGVCWRFGVFGIGERRRRKHHGRGDYTRDDEFRFFHNIYPTIDEIDVARNLRPPKQPIKTGLNTEKTRRSHSVNYHLACRLRPCQLV